MSINPNKTKSIKNLGAIDITQLKLYVDKLSDKVWESETKSRENDFPCFHHTEHIIFRFPDQLTDRTVVHSNPIWPIWKPLLLPVMKQAVHPYGYSSGEFKAVMLARLKAGSSIDLHRDGSPSYYFLHKIHIPIQTNKNVSFYIHPNTYYLEEGVAYEVNNLVSHGVENKGDVDRIHLIFEYLDQPKR